MTTRLPLRSRTLSFLCGLLLLVDGPSFLIGEPTVAAISAFDVYIRSVEARLAQQHRSMNGFLASVDADRGHGDLRLRQGEVIVERLTASAGPYPSGAQIHHWRGTAFAPGARAADFERMMRDFRSYPQNFSPQVVQARVLGQEGDNVQAWMRVRQHHVITVVMDTTYDIVFGHLDVAHGYSISRSTRITEVSGEGTNAERSLDVNEEHGFLWRLNTYWSYEERDGGLYLQVEAVSLTRSVPSGLGWAIRPYVESIPRESMEFTLRSACKAIQK